MISNSRKWIKTSQEELTLPVYCQCRGWLLIHLLPSSCLSPLSSWPWIPYFRPSSSAPGTFPLLSFFHYPQFSSTRSRSTFLSSPASSSFRISEAYPSVRFCLNFGSTTSLTFSLSAFVALALSAFFFFRIPPNLHSTLWKIFSEWNSSFFWFQVKFNHGWVSFRLFFLSQSAVLGI